MKTLLILLIPILSYCQDTTQWETIRVVIGTADTIWREGSWIDVKESNEEKRQVQYRSNGYFIQQRFRKRQ